MEFTSKTKEQLVREIKNEHDKYLEVKFKLEKYKVYMFSMYALGLILFGVVLTIIIVKGLS